MKLVLWDIDGTLVQTARAGRRAIDRAFADVHGWFQATHGIRFDGYTDPWIVEEVYRQRGHEPKDPLAERNAVLARYVEHLADELASLEETGLPYGPLPGVVAALEALAREERCLQALLTGNIETGGRRKLARFDLDRYFAFGAWGDDAPERPGLLPVALTRARAARPEVAFEPARAVVVGDTPRDVAVGHAHGARTIAVATGSFTREQLEACKPDFVFQDLSDTRAFVGAVLG